MLLPSERLATTGQRPLSRQIVTRLKYTSKARRLPRCGSHSVLAVLAIEPGSAGRGVLSTGKPSGGLLVASCAAPEPVSVKYRALRSLSIWIFEFNWGGMRRGARGIANMPSLSQHCRRQRSLGPGIGETWSTVGIVITQLPVTRAAPAQSCFPRKQARSSRAQSLSTTAGSD
jgi:hypothetical protein